MMQFFRSNVRWIMLVIVVLFVFSIFAGYGSFFSGSSSSGSGSGSGDHAVAKINGKKIMLSEVEQALNQELEKMGPEQQISSTDYPFIRGMILEQMAIMSELEKEVKERKISPTKDEVEIEFKRIADQFPTREIFLEQIKNAGMTEDQVKSDIKKQLGFNKVMQAAVEGASYDQKEAREFYDAMKDYYFKVPEGYRLNVAQFSTAKSAEGFRKSLNATGSNWDQELGKVSSEDLMGSTPYGEPGMIPLSQITGPTETIKKTPANRPSSVIKVSSEDFLVVIKRGSEKERVRSFDEVSKDVEETLLHQARQKLQGEYIKGLKDKAAIEKLDVAYFTPVSADVSPDVAEQEDVSADK